MSGTQAAAGRMARARSSVRDSASKLLTKALPASGSGPKEGRLEPWRWRMDIRARTTGGNEAHVEIDADGHPGYLATAKMLGEAGLLMAEDGATPDVSGCLTPSVALGSGTAPRFARADLRFSVVP